MTSLIQSSYSRGTYRTPLTEATGISTEDVHNQIVTDRPNPIKVGWEFVDPFLVGTGPIAPPLTGFGPGSIYLVGPDPSWVGLGNNYLDIWINTGVPQSSGVGNWALLYHSYVAGGAGAGGGGGDGAGSGGGDGGEG